MAAGAWSSMTLLLASTELRDAVLGSGMERGLSASYDRVDRLMVELAARRRSRELTP